jgi:hypothetical protein
MVIGASKKIRILKSKQESDNFLWEGTQQKAIMWAVKCPIRNINIAWINSKTLELGVIDYE